MGRGRRRRIFGCHADFRVIQWTFLGFCFQYVLNRARLLLCSACVLLSFERERKAKKEDASFALLSSVVDSMDDREA